MSIRLSEIKKKTGVNYNDIYEACDDLGIELKKRHHSTTLSVESAESLYDYFSSENMENAPKKTKKETGRKTKKKPKMVSDGEIIINAELKDGQKKKEEPFVDKDFEEELDELEIFEEETGKKFSKEERNKRKSRKKNIDNLSERELKEKKEQAKQEQKRKEEQQEEQPVIQLEDFISVKEFADKLNVNQNEIIKKLMLLGVTNVTQPLDYDVASLIAEDFGYETENKQEAENKRAEALRAELLKPRPAVVTIMGHVDHGKTTLLDNIRKSNVVARESGGITQHIGAYQITWKKNKITFIDTPGHEAFTEMRAQGANVTDIAIIVISADDGLKPQTMEAVDHAKAAEVPIIIAINKIDKPGANPEKVKQELAGIGLTPESWGGDTITVELSAKNGINIEELLEMIILVAEMEEFKAEYDISAHGVIVESFKHKGKGPLATVVVQQGVLHKGDIVVSGVAYGRIKAMFDEYGKNVERAEPSKPVELMGLSEVPHAGDKFKVVANEKLAREITSKHAEKVKNQKMKLNRAKTIEDIFSSAAEEEKKKLNIILKSDVRGTGTAIKESIDKLQDEEIDVKVIHSGVGMVSETDINLAVASDAIIIGFNVRESANAKKLAEKEGVEIRTYKIIYEIIDDIKKFVRGMWETRYEDVVIGSAKVLTTFKVPKAGVIAGCKVENGVVKRKAKVKLIRDGVEIYSSKVSSLKRFKDDVKEVSSGYECGVGIENYNDIKEDDIIEFIEEQEEEREA
ncbi:MAG: translation initiation factor IF-2 [Candidatus Muiribacteriota bacterium]